jgi:PAS domain S-box-containing protein
MHALELLTTQFNAILDTTPSAIITTDKLGSILTFNAGAERIFGYKMQEMIGKNVKCLMPASIAERHDDYLRNFQETGQSKTIGIHGKLEAKRKNSESFPIRLRINSMTYADKLYFFGVIDDISETRSLQNQLVLAQKLEAIGQLASGVAHEINTPIQYIGDNLSALKENFADIVAYQQDLLSLADAPLKSRLADLTNKYDLEFILNDSPKAIKQAQDGVARVTEIVKAMKSFSHIESSQTMQRINLHEALQSALIISRNNYKYLAEIETDFSPEADYIECYPNELNQVFLNLIINAAHAIEEKQAGMGLIRISTQKLGEMVEVLINDNGNGISAEIQEKVFNLFFTTKPVGKGTGQGLCLSHSIIVEKHHGKLFFTSDIGIGTTFHIQLPYKQA